MPNGEHGRGKEFDGKTFLYIKTHVLDDGTEPLPAGLEAWLSPDIVVIKPDGTRGAEAVAGDINQVEVTVTNDGGIDAVDAYVEAFVANPSLGFTPATSTLIGGGFLTIPGYTRQAIAFSWVPPVSEAGHRCLAARVNLTIPLDGYYDGTIFDVRGDRHVAQRNISVVALGTNQMMMFSFRIINPKRAKQRYAVQVRQVTDPQRLRSIGRTLGSDLLQFSVRELKTYGLQMGKPGKDDDGEAPPSHDRRMARTAETGAAVRDIPERREFRLDMEANEVRSCDLLVAREAGASLGELQVLEVIQVNAKQQSVGGLTIVVQH